MMGLSALLGCGRIGFDPISASVADIGPLTVTAVYPVYSSWGQYIANAAPELGAFDQSGEPCEPSTGGSADQCLHAGEIRRVAIPELRSCADLALRDELGVFRWQCRELESSIEFVSLLEPGRGLRHLVSADAWLSNRVILQFQGEDVASSELAAWHSNPVIALPDNSASPVVLLEDANAVYTLAESRASNGYNLNADGLSVVTLGDATLSAAPGMPGNTTWASGELDQAGTATALLTAGGQNFTWIEGNFDGGSSAHYAVFVRNGAYNRLRGVTVFGATAAGVLYRTSRSIVEELVAANNGGRGLYTHNSYFCVLRNIVASNNALSGILMEYSDDNVVANAVCTNNADSGISISSQRNTVIGLLSAHNGVKGVYSWAGSDSTFVHLLVADNQTRGVSMEGGAINDVFAKVVSAHNGEADVGLAAVENMVFTDVLMTNTCWVQAGNASPGLVSNTCANADASDATLVQGIDLAESFAGPLDVDDTVNSSDQGGAAPYSEIRDWARFETPYRTWGRAGSGVPDSTARGRCVDGDGCRIWDWSVLASELALDNRNPQGAFVLDGTSCPTSLASAITDATGHRFLLNAFELSVDGRGNDNGLCEPGEACLFRDKIGPLLQSSEPSSTQCTMLAGEFADTVIGY